LIITALSGPALAGVVGLGDRGGRAVRAGLRGRPDRQDRGYATQAVRLAADWPLHQGQGSMAGLRIASGNPASQRVAAAVGFIPAGTIRSRVPSGQTCDDLRFVMGRRRRR
jgi:RimJ/RimL family protein N-acetyltransferase